MDKKNISSFEINSNRDKVILDAIKYCLEKHKPILGICLGLQFLNVAYGGTLKQDIKNHNEVRHYVKIDKNSILHDYLGDTYYSNSKHHQCIDNLGAGLKVIALSEDGIIEAIEDEKNKILGVQWHPEKMEDNYLFQIFKTML